MGTFTIEAANDPNALNKSVHLRLPANYLTLNEIVSLWEKKIGKTLEKIYVPEEKVLKEIQGMLQVTTLFIIRLHKFIFVHVLVASIV